MAIRPGYDPDWNALFCELASDFTPGRWRIAFMLCPRTAAWMNQHEALRLLAIRNTEASRKSSDGEWRGPEERSIRKFRDGRKRLDEGPVSVVPRNVRILELDRAIDKSVSEFARDPRAESVAERRPGHSRQDSTLQNSMKIQDEVEATIPQLTYRVKQRSKERQPICCPKEFDKLTARKNECLVDHSGRVHDTRRSGLDQPGDMRPGVERAKGDRSRQ